MRIEVSGEMLQLNVRSVELESWKGVSVIGVEGTVGCDEQVVSGGLGDVGSRYKLCWQFERYG